MKKILIVIISSLLAVARLSAQKNILFLLPLDADKIAQTEVESINYTQDIDNLFGKTLIHFWEGAQIAISELGDEGNDFNVIVRDVTDATKLERVLEEPVAQKADLIIAPLYGRSHHRSPLRQTVPDSGRVRAQAQDSGCQPVHITA